MRSSRFDNYNAARVYYLDKPAIISRRRPFPVIARALMLSTALIAGAAAVVMLPAAAMAVPAAKYLGAVGAWTYYNHARKYLLTGDIDLNSSSFRMTLHTSASNAATATLSTIASVTGELTEANGYSSSGKAMTVAYTVGASAGTYKFSAASLVWTATGGNIANIKFACIWVTGASAGARKLLARSQLSTSQFTLTTPNTLTISGTVFNVS